MLKQSEKWVVHLEQNSKSFRWLENANGEDLNDNTRPNITLSKQESYISKSSYGYCSSIETGAESMVRGSKWKNGFKGESKGFVTSRISSMLYYIH